jgi:hypothetical protein
MTLRPAALPARLNAIRPNFPAAPRRAGAAELLDAALLLLVVLARGLEIDAEQLGAETAITIAEPMVPNM